MKNATKECFCFMAAVTLATAVRAQEIRCVQFDATPLAVNPAFTGMFNGGMRASMIYRNEFSAFIPDVSYGGSFDMPVYVSRKGDYVAGGIQMIKDVAGDGNLSNFGGMVSVAYHKLLGKDYMKEGRGMELAGGLQVGYTQRTINFTDMFFGGYGHSMLQNYQLGLGNAVSYYIINGGVSFSHAVSRRFSYVMGISANNINEPRPMNEPNANYQVGMGRSYGGTLGAEWVVNRLTIRPAVLFIYYPITIGFVGGSDIRYSLSKKNGAKGVSVFFGGWYRTDLITSFTAGVEYKTWKLGMGYDATAGQDGLSNGSQGIEIVVRYRSPARASNRRKVVPCNRF